MTSKERLHWLIDALPEREWTAAERLLTSLRDGADPLVRGLLNAPDDDEPETPAEATAVAEAKAALARGEVEPLDAIRADLLIPCPVL